MGNGASSSDLTRRPVLVVGVAPERLPAARVFGNHSFGVCVCFFRDGVAAGFLGVLEHHKTTSVTSSLETVAIHQRTSSPCQAM